MVAALFVAFTVLLMAVSLGAVICPARQSAESGQWPNRVGLP